MTRLADNNDPGRAACLEGAATARKAEGFEQAEELMVEYASTATPRAGHAILV
jgi:hypothetical protein